MDSGDSWKALSNIAGVSAVALDPISPSTIYAGTWHGLLKSTNGGVSWISAGLSDTSINTLVVDPITPSTLYAAASVDDHISKSTDAGGSWIALSLGLSPGARIGPLSITLDPVTPSTLYVVGSSGLRKSTDGGGSWNVINAGLFTSSLVIDPTTPTTMYARKFSSLTKSMDGGASWTATGLKADILTLSIDPNNPNILYAATPGPGQAIFKSTDGGQSWNTVDTSIPPTASLVFSPNSSTIYAATLSGGVFKSTNAGTNWGAANTGLSIFDIRVLVGDPVDPATIYTGGGDGLFKSTDSGGSWNKLADFQVMCCTPSPGIPPGLSPPSTPAGVRSLLVDFTNPNILYAGTYRPNGCVYTDTLLFKSTNGGAGWSDSITPKESGCILDGLMVMDPTDPNTLYVGEGGDFGDYYAFLKSTDGGASWNITGLGTPANVLVIDPTSPTTLYAGTYSGVLQSTDGGAKWNITGLTKTNVNVLAIDPLQPNILYAGTTGADPYNLGSMDSLGFGGLFKSTDSGASWLPINDGLGDLLDTRANVNALIRDPSNADVLYAATSGYGVFKSSDGGATWAPSNDGLTHLDVPVLAIVWGAVYAGTPGGVFKIVADGN
jgi:photosystem II stability/assembly factor-like uncharacterized protein